ncbi:MAG: CCA tRNA nucleotidyltransferase [Candidatus Diapherotrites archaeon]|nr:CCA tRNA nucleotidyltransferase [Candidatus Diapherotrites archaeon]
MSEFNQKIYRIEKIVLRKVKPTEDEYKKELAFLDEQIKRLRKICPDYIEIKLAGSFARNTHLKNDKDIDIFLLFPKDFNEERFIEEGLSISKKFFKGHSFEESFSDHPYIKGKINGYEIEIVPSYKVDFAYQLKSAVDRTPFHNDYLLKKLSEKQKDEIRLLKQFLKGIGSYGAELRYNALPGYVSELLILYYGNFLNCLKAISNWKSNEVIDIENYYRKQDAIRRFNSHLIVVDPVDMNRNVAAALSYNQYARIIAAARAFLKKPSLHFFFGRKYKDFELKKLKEILSKKELVAVYLPYPKNVLADIVWGQSKRICKKITNVLSINDFVINRFECWTDENKNIVLIFELESLCLQRIKKKIGPEVIDFENSDKFLEAHKKSCAGPRIEDGRWVVEVERKYVRVSDLLKDILRDLAKTEKEPIVNCFPKYKILNEDQIFFLYKSNIDFKKFLSEYLRGKESFL